MNDDLCVECDHPLRDHPDGWVCRAADCDCIEFEKALWGPGGPVIGQVVPLKDIPGVSLRWDGFRWVMA